MNGEAVRHVLVRLPKVAGIDFSITNEVVLVWIAAASTFLLLTPAAFESWLSDGVLLGIAAGALLLLPAILLPRPAQVAACAVALLSSLFTPLFVPDVLRATAPLTLFNWRYGHLLNFNGLTKSVLVAWPLAAALWLFALAGQPGWGLAAAPEAGGPGKHDPL